MEILSMNVVVSAIVDPWVTTLSFVVALAMRIQESNATIFAPLRQLVKNPIVSGYFVDDSTLASSSKSFDFSVSNSSGEGQVELSYIFSMGYHQTGPLPL